MKIQKALITAAGPGQNSLPLQRLVDRDGVEKSALEMIIEEVDASGIESIAIVICPGDEEPYRKAAGKYVDRITFVTQPVAKGYGDAILQTRDFVGNDSVLHLVGDHLYLSSISKRCSQQLIEVAESENCPVSAVQATRESMLPYFGTVAANRVPRHDTLYEVKRVVEKPTPTQAEQDLTVAGLRSGTYLCYFGMHVLTPSVFKVMTSIASRANRPFSLSEAMNEVASRERYLACQIQGTRYNIGVKYGLLNTQLALSLSGVDRDHILSELVEQLAVQPTLSRATGS
ncbi:MAG: sugar phosphate nucleotidyltransferase [Pirellulaceae bacterium]|nr:sugar phosphate nucleotidyltransferase [Pirellulaceae bacterium]